MRSSIDDTYFDIQLTISEDKKHLTVFSNNCGEYKNNLFDELNNFIEYDFSIIYQSKGRLEQIYNEIEFGKNDFSDLYKYQNFINICKDIAKSFERDLPGLYMSLDTMLEDKFSLTDCYTIDLITSMDKIWYELENIAVMQRDIEGLFYNLAEQQLNNTDRSKTLVSQHSGRFVTETVLSYNYGNFSYTVIANTPQQFYATLTVFYFSSHPLIALCQYCGRYFTPKTKKVTLFCAERLKITEPVKKMEQDLNIKTRLRVILCFINSSRKSTGDIWNVIGCLFITVATLRLKFIMNGLTKQRRCLKNTKMKTFLLMR